MAKVTFNIKGLDTVIKQIDKRGNEVRELLEDELAAFAVNTVNQAKRMAPVDEGRLRNSIAWVLEPLTAKITVGVNYAAFQEFGTGKYARAYVPGLPAEWRDLAAQFKGRNIEGGIPQQPYLFIPVTDNQKKLVDNLKAKL
jgi:phage gpG-like protein